MTDKEILAELTKCNDYLYDIYNNACVEHGDGQLNAELINKISEATDNIEYVYNAFYDTLDKEELRVKGLYEEKGEKIYISNGIGCGYDIYKNGEFSDYFTCEDCDYYWYDDNDFLNDYEEEK